MTKYTSELDISVIGDQPYFWVTANVLQCLHDKSFDDDLQMGIYAHTEFPASVNPDKLEKILRALESHHPNFSPRLHFADPNTAVPESMHAEICEMRLYRSTTTSESPDLVTLKEVGYDPNYLSLLCILSIEDALSLLATGYILEVGQEIPSSPSDEGN